MAFWVEEKGASLEAQQAGRRSRRRVSIPGGTVGASSVDKPTAIESKRSVPKKIDSLRTRKERYAPPFRCGLTSPRKSLRHPVSRGGGGLLPEPDSITRSRGQSSEQNWLVTARPLETTDSRGHSRPDVGNSRSIGDCPCGCRPGPAPY